MNFIMPKHAFAEQEAYAITTEAGQTAYRIETYGSQITLCDMQRTERFHIERHPSRITPECDIYSKNTFCATTKRQMRFLGRSLIDVSGNCGELFISGDLERYDFDICQNNAHILHSAQASPTAPSYQLWIADTYDKPDFLCILSVAIDICMHQRNK